MMKQTNASNEQAEPAFFAPSQGAMRASAEVASIIIDRFTGLRPRGETLNEVARIIDRETAHAEVVAGLKRLDAYLKNQQIYLAGVMEGNGDENSLTPQKLVRDLLAKAQA